MELSIHEFLWKQSSCADLGMMVTRFPPVTRAKERVKSITIPGRAGTLTQVEGVDVFDAYTMTITCAVQADADMAMITDWLSGSGELITGTEPLYVYDARIVNQTDLQWMFQDGTRQVAIPFYVQPLKRLAQTEPDIEVLQSGQIVENIGTTHAYPAITLTVSDAAAIDPETNSVDDITLTIHGADNNGQTVNVTGMQPGETIVLDWHMGDAYEWSTLANWNNRVVGNPQYLSVGDNTITYSGAPLSSIVITPYWRFV